MSYGLKDHVSRRVACGQETATLRVWIADSITMDIGRDEFRRDRNIIACQRSP
jgi:hypothetical protein